MFLVTPLNSKISFFLNAKIKTTFEFICHNRAKKTCLWASSLLQMSQSSKRSLTLATIRLQITIVLLASLDCCNQQPSKLVLQKLWRFSKFTNDSYLVYLFSVEFCSPNFFFLRTCFHFVFCFVFSQLLAIEKRLAIFNDQQRIKLKTLQCN